MQKKLYPTNKKSQNNNCPTCGFHISHSDTFESILAGNFDNERDGSYVATRITPIRASTIEADVLVPAAQSLIWSVVVSLPAIPVSFWLRYEWYFPAAVGTVAMLVSWISSMKRVENSLAKVEEFEYTSNAETSSPETIGSEASGIKMTMIDRSARGAETWKIVDLPPGVTQKKLDEFLKSISLGGSLARGEWTPERRHFSRDQYDQIISSLLEGNIVIDVPGRGKRLSEIGRVAVIGYVATLENTQKIN